MTLPKLSILGLIGLLTISGCSATAANSPASSSESSSASTASASASSSPSAESSESSSAEISTEETEDDLNVVDAPPSWAADTFTGYDADWLYLANENKAMALYYGYDEDAASTYLAKLIAAGWVYDMDPQKLSEDGVSSYVASLQNDSGYELTFVATSSGAQASDGTATAPVTALTLTK